MDFTITLTAGSSLQAGPFNITITDINNSVRTYSTGVTRAALASGYYVGGLTSNDKTITATSTGTCTTNASVDIASATGAATSTINGVTTLSPSTLSGSGTITVVGSATKLRIGGFGGASAGTSGYLTVTVLGSGGTSTPSPATTNLSLSAYASQACNTSNSYVTLPVGTYTYSMSGTFSGSAGNNMYICLYP